MIFALVSVNVDILTELVEDEANSLYFMLDDLLHQSIAPVSSTSSPACATASGKDTAEHPLHKAALFFRAIQEIAQVTVTDKGA